MNEVVSNDILLEFSHLLYKKSKPTVSLPNIIYNFIARWYQPYTFFDYAF